MCVFTVFTEITSAVAISSFDRPPPIRVSTSTSRPVSCRRAGVGRSGRGAAT